MNRNVKSYNSKVRVFVYSYTDDNSLSATKTEITHITQVITDKTLSQPSGTFTLKLAASKNWKKIIKPGDWVTIEFSNKGEYRLKMLGNVDRVTRTKEIDQDSGSLKTIFVVYGRDFGKVFEKTNIYFNAFLSRQIAVDNIVLRDGLLLLGSPTQIISKILQIFLGSGTENIPELNQWLIPKNLKADILVQETISNTKQKGSSFYDILKQDLNETVGYKAYQNVSNIQGYLWNLLKQNSNEAINELFLELKYDKQTQTVRPTISLRPHPFSLNNLNEEFSDNVVASNLGKIIYYKDLERVKITDEDIIFEDLGESDHVRFNFIFMTASGIDFAGENAFASWSNTEPKIPIVNENSIQKHGLNMRTDVTDFANLTTKVNSEQFDPTILKNFNILLNHWYKDAHLLESGTLKIVGNINVELGKTVEVEFKKLGETYLYYIEGYSNDFQFPNLWTTTLKLSRGYRLDSKELKTIENQNSENKKYTGISIAKRNE